MENSTHSIDILSCNICSKTFDNRKSQLRHTSYCRRAKARVTTRKKACKSCTRAKTRCDLKSRCLRCITKNLDCLYELPRSPSEAGLSIPIPPPIPTPTESGIETTNISTLDQMMHISKPFAPKRIKSKDFPLNRSFILASLKIYPYMILPGQSLPPFIHPHFAFQSQESDNQVQGRKVRQPPLQNCVAIIRWYSKRDKDNTTFVGNTIRVEVERLVKEYVNYSDSDTVATLQALTVYILLRIAQDENDAALTRAIDDPAMIRAMGTVATKLKFLIQKHNTPSADSIPEWEDWVMAESLRRTLTVILLVDLLFDINGYFPVQNCQGNILESISLPCAKGLWEASSKSEWEKQYADMCDHQKGRILPTYVDLMRDHRVEGTFDHWLSQLDSLGTVVMAAASLQPPSLVDM